MSWHLKLVAIAIWVLLLYYILMLTYYNPPQEARGQPFTTAPGNISCYKPHYSEGLAPEPLCCWNIKDMKPDVFLGCVR